MRKIFLLLIVLASVSFAAIDECKTDVYFGNGILTEEEDAEINAGILEDAIIEKFGLDYYRKHIGEVSYAYNNTFGFGQDIYESGLQITNLIDLKEWWDKLIKRYKKSAHETDLKLQVDKYEASIKAGHKVLVVAHSQGNLFAHEAYEQLEGLRGQAIMIT